MIEAFGSITVVGLADLAQAGATENAAYVEGATTTTTTSSCPVTRRRSPA